MIFLFPQSNIHFSRRFPFSSSLHTEYLSLYISIAHDFLNLFLMFSISQYSMRNRKQITNMDVRFMSHSC
jgi:hypothetical protein